MGGKHVKQLSLDVTRAQIKEMEKETFAFQSNGPERIAAPKENEMLSPPAQNPKHVTSYTHSDKSQLTNLRDFTPKILNENNRKLNQAMTFGEEDITPKSSKTEEHKFERIKTINEIIGNLDKEAFQNSLNQSQKNACISFDNR